LKEYNLGRFSVQLEKYSLGVGDRFGHQGKAQLQAVISAKADGVNIVPVWNKSYREHSIIGTSPKDTYKAAVEAVKAMRWEDSYYVDADHIQIRNVDLFIDSSNFFTIDVADSIGQSASEVKINDFVRRYKKYAGNLSVPGIEEKFYIDNNIIDAIAHKYLKAVDEAASIYRHIESIKGKDNFVTEISMDETDAPQKPVELLFILAAASDRGIPLQTIAPKFTGKFNKGIDYVGDIGHFAKEFEQDIAILAFAVKEFDLPSNLKLSIHSGSDKFSIYKSINKVLKKFDAGLHLKTAGTTWLEELMGLAGAGGEGLSIAKRIYSGAFERFEELCMPYAKVVEIDKIRLPAFSIVDSWSSDDFVKAVRHDLDCKQYDKSVRQLLHLAYKIAAEMKGEFTGALEEYEKYISPCVTENLYKRHIRPLFIE